MGRKKTVAFASGLLIIALSLLYGEKPSLAGEKAPPQISQSSTRSNSAAEPPNEDVNSEVPTCSGCSTAETAINDVVIPAGTIFYSGTNCICIGYKSITISPNVTIEAGATVTFSAPKVYIQNGFKAILGSVVSIETEEPPPPP